METTTELVGRCIDGEQDAWNEMVRRFGGLVHHVARQYRLSRVECDDVAQHCWLQLVRRIDTISDPERCGEWLAAVARNEAMKVLSRGRRAIPVDAPVLEARTAAMPGPDAGLLARELRDEVVAAMDDLPPRCRDFLQVFMNEESATYEQVADRFGMNANSVGSTRTRYLRKLRDVLAVRGVTVQDLAE